MHLGCGGHPHGCQEEHVGSGEIFPRHLPGLQQAEQGEEDQGEEGGDLQGQDLSAPEQSYQADAAPAPHYLPVLGIGGGGGGGRVEVSDDDKQGQEGAAEEDRPPEDGN